MGWNGSTRSLIGVGLCLGLAAPAAAVDLPTAAIVPHVTTSGSAHVEVKPDLATINLGVTIEKPAAADALAEVARLAKGVIDDLAAQGVAERDIRTTDLSLVPLYDETSDGRGRPTKQVLRGYQAQELLAVRIREVDKAGTLARRALDHGANSFNGVDFDLDHMAERRLELGGVAAKQAQTQAEIYAKALGETLGRVLDVETQDGVGLNHARFARPAAAAVSPKAADMPIPLAAGVISVDAAVRVTFELKAP